MTFLRKLFGLKRKPDSGTESRNDEMITIYDELGREMQVTREEWREKVLLGNLEKAYNDPDALYEYIVSGLNDGFVDDLRKPAERLLKIDPDPFRATCILGIVYTQLKKLSKAEALFKNCMNKHGEHAYVLTNLAKVYGERMQPELELETLWHALELDPNQENGVIYYVSLIKERDGEAGERSALERMASLPGSWRPQIWQARALLECKDLDAAMALYRHALATVKDPVPADMLMQISGDLGQRGYLLEILDLVGPHFAPSKHGLAVGNNLLKAYHDLGMLESGYELLSNLQACQRPDWRQTLGFWDNEYNQLKMEVEDPVAEEDIRVSMLGVEGPVWYNAEDCTRDLVTPRSSNAVRVGFLAGTVDAVRSSKGMQMELSDVEGRVSRAIPLYMNEALYCGYDVNSLTLIPWMENRGGFILSGQPWKDDSAAAQRISEEEGLDYVVTTHLVVRGENWKLQLRVIRCIDALCFGKFSFDFAEGCIEPILKPALEEIIHVLRREANMKSLNTFNMGALRREEVDHYLFRLEQTLAVRCSTMDGVSRGFLCNPTEIVDGVIELGVRNPYHLPPRLILLRILKRLSEKQPKLVASYEDKVNYLFREHSVGTTFDRTLESAFRQLFRSITLC